MTYTLGDSSDSPAITMAGMGGTAGTGGAAQTDGTTGSDGTSIFCPEAGCEGKLFLVGYKDGQVIYRCDWCNIKIMESELKKGGKNENRS